MRNFLIPPLMAAVVALLVGGAQAQALEILNPPVKVSAGKKTASSQTAGQGKKAKFLPGSEETVKQRRDRLQRECKGAVNAGACSGYTR